VACPKEGEKAKKARASEILKALKALYLEGFVPATGEAYRLVYRRAREVLP